MRIVVMAERDCFEKALASARAEQGAQLKGLAAPISGALGGMIAEAWDAIEGALRKAFAWGTDRAREAIDNAVALAESLAERAGKQVREFQEAITQRLRAYHATFVDETLARIRSSVVLGDRTLALDNVELTHKVILTNSLKATITEVCSLAASGETAIVARYGSLRSSTGS
jgi:hypothetical protein